MKIEECKTGESRCRGCGEDNKVGIQISYDDGNGQILNLCPACREVFKDFFSPPKRIVDYWRLRK